MDRLKAMRVFAAISASGSLSAAGRQLGMPLTTVSRYLATLERTVGTTLVVRTTRHIALTESGREYLDACRRVLDEIDTVEGRLSGQRLDPFGELVVTAPVVFGRMHVLPVIEALLRKYPRVDARLILLDRNVDLVEEGIDVAVRIGRLQDSTMICRQVGTVSSVVCASPGYLKSRGTPLTPEQLAGHDCITFSGLGAANHWTFEEGRASRRMRIKSRLSVNTAEAAVDAAEAGLGITRVLSYQVVAPLAQKRLVRLLARFEGPDLPVSLLHREGRLQQAKVQSFLALAAEMIPKRLGVRDRAKGALRRAKGS